MVRTEDFLDVINELVAFVRVAEAGSFSAAARRHGLTPSAISRQVARLEKSMGISLMRRTTRQLSLTEAGIEVLERGREMVTAAQGCMRVAEGHMGKPKGLVRVSAPKAFSRHVLHKPLLSFLQKYPEVDVHLLVVDRLVDPLQEGVDLVIRLTENPPQSMVARSLMPVRQLVLASPAYLASHESIHIPEDLMAHSCLSTGEQEHDSHWRFVRGEGEVKVAVAGRYILNHSEMRLAAVEAGLGVGCVPDFVARDALTAGRIVPLLTEWTFDTNYQGMAYLLYSTARYTTPKVRALIDHLVTELQLAADLPPSSSAPACAHGGEA